MSDTTGKQWYGPAFSSDGKVQELKVARTEPFDYTRPDHEAQMKRVIQRMYGIFPRVCNCVDDTWYREDGSGRRITESTEESIGFNLCRISPLYHFSKYGMGDRAEYEAPYSKAEAERVLDSLSQFPNSWFSFGTRAAGKGWPSLKRKSGAWVVDVLVSFGLPTSQECLDNLTEVAASIGVADDLSISTPENNTFLITSTNPHLESPGKVEFREGCQSPESVWLKLSVDRLDEAKQLLEKATSFCLPSRERLSLTVKIGDDFIRKACNRLTTAWYVRGFARWTYGSGYGGGTREKAFSPLRPPERVQKGDPFRYPLLALSAGGCAPKFQMDIVYNTRKAFLELQTIASQKKLAEMCDRTGLLCEVWDGLPHLRWNGKGNF